MDARTRARLYYARRRNRAAVIVDLKVAPAWFWIKYSQNPADTDTLVFDTTTITFVAGTPSAGQVKIGATLTATLDNAIAYFVAHPPNNKVGSIARTGASALLFLTKAPGDTTSITMSASTTGVTYSSLGFQKQKVRSRIVADADTTNNAPDAKFYGFDHTHTDNKS